MSSSPTQTQSKPRPFSIDLSLELERQLESESLPSSPVPAPSSTTSNTNGNGHSHTASGVLGDFQLPALDPAVLAHIITQLRHSLTEMTKERDDLLTLLSTAHSKEAELNDALQHLTDKATSMEEELSEARRKSKDDDEAISMLRSKVEESRRGLMRLQTENRRQSIQPLDMSRSSISSLTFSPPSSKRASFTPLTGTYNARVNGHGHNRGASVSDSLLDLNLDPNVQTLTVQDKHDSTASHPPVSGRRFSGLFGGRGSPPQDSELEAIKKELAAVKSDLEDTRNELSEAMEAREASESCVKTLREFIAENTIGSATNVMEGIPALSSGSGSASSPTNEGKKGWGFNLWKVDTNVKPQSGPGSAVTPHAIQAATPIAPTATATGNDTPISRKIGGFFSRTSSISSAAEMTADRRSVDVS